MPPQLKNALFTMDREKVSKPHREYDNKFKSNRNKAFHDQFRNVLTFQTKDKNGTQSIGRKAVSNKIISLTNVRIDCMDAVARMIIRAR